MTDDLTYDFAAVPELVEAAGLWTSVCVIKRPTQAMDPVSGQVNLDPADATIVTGCDAIPCRKAPLNVGSPNPQYKIKLPAEVDEMNVFHVSMNGWFPQIQQRDYAIIDGEFFEVLVNEPASSYTMGRLAVRRWAQ